MNDFNNKSDGNKEIKKEEIKADVPQKKDEENAKFPEWNILPPNQIINPRLKSKE